MRIVVHGQQAFGKAVLEALLDRGARVVLTTHYPELKGLDDPRVVVGAMEHEAGRPTYRRDRPCRRRRMPGPAGPSQR